MESIRRIVPIEEVRNRLSSKKSNNKNSVVEKSTTASFSDHMVSECKKYTDDMDKINKIIGG